MKIRLLLLVGILLLLGSVPVIAYAYSSEPQGFWSSLWNGLAEFFGSFTATGAVASCNGNGICQPGFGETVENCPSDCTCNNNGFCEMASETSLM